MLDVGCNKGYESAALFSVMDPGAGLSAALVHEALEAVKADLKLGPTEGQCQDHKHNPAKGAAKLPANPGSVTVHCFEPSSSNFRCARVGAVGAARGLRSQAGSRVLLAACLDCVSSTRHSPSTTAPHPPKTPPAPPGASRCSTSSSSPPSRGPGPRGTSTTWR
jgi:hypothetical protein